MTSNSRSNDQQKVQAIVETLQQRVVDHLKAHGPQSWETLVVELNQNRTGHIHTALKELQQWKTIKMRGWMVCLTEEVSILSRPVEPVLFLSFKRYFNLTNRCDWHSLLTLTCLDRLSFTNSLTSPSH